MEHRSDRLSRAPGRALATVWMVAALGSGLLVAQCGPAGADQISDLQAQATQISQEILREQMALGAYEQQYNAANQRVSDDGMAIGLGEVRIDQDQQRITLDRAQLKNEAVYAYMTSTNANGNISMFSSDQPNTDATNEYAQDAVGLLSSTIDRLHSDETALSLEEGALRTTEAQDEAAQSQVASLFQQSQNTERELSQQGTEIQGQLAAAVAQHQAAETTAVTSYVATDPALPPFLQCALQAESGGDYSVVSPNGEYMGGFQFEQDTWNEAAMLAGRPDLVGVPPNEASPADQDTLAIALYQADGEQPWDDPCRN